MIKTNALYDFLQQQKTDKLIQEVKQTSFSFLRLLHIFYLINTKGKRQSDILKDNYPQT